VNIHIYLKKKFLLLPNAKTSKQEQLLIEVSFFFSAREINNQGQDMQLVDG